MQTNGNEVVAVRVKRKYGRGNAVIQCAATLRRAGRVILNRRIRNLIEQLGEAIHETIAESEQIAGVVRNMRAEGFEVMLMLEATIGLNEAEKESAEAAGHEGPASGPFTAQDLHFLQSLRIRVAEEENSEAAD